MQTFSKHFTAFLFANLLAVFITAGTLAQSVTTRAPIAYLIEVKTGSVLFAKDGNAPFEPTTLSKVMTAAVVFHALKSGEIADDTHCRVSEHAWRTGGAPAGGATMFAELGSDIAIPDLLKGLLIHQANDAAIILAECLEGDEAGFAARMNRIAAEIGMFHSRFSNPAGFETGDARTTAEDLAVLGRHILLEYADQYALFSLPEFTWNDIFQLNRNRALGDMRGLDGFGLGHTSDGQEAALSSLERDGQRVVAVVAGLPSAKARAQAVKQVIESAWDLYSVRTIFKKGDEVARAKVHGGVQSDVPLIAASDVNVLLPNSGTLDYKIRATYFGPLVAPVEPGRLLGELRIYSGDQVVQHVPLIIGGQRIEKGDLLTRAIDGLDELLFGWM